MPSLISNNCDSSFKSMEESLEENNRQQQYYSITLGEDELLKAVKTNESVRLVFTLHLTETTSVEWETIIWRGTLYIRVPSCLLPEGSKEGFVSLLEYAEETLHCSNVVICLRKDRTDRAMLVRTFMFLGFTVLPPNHSLVPPNCDPGNLYMLYTVDE
ncbi:hypothetical protein KQX54_002466 [Cotesia glomerata]|uniref:Ornithine decarboxylase antizyme n=1 Tax=Cotesia glomerata TaxID=32391 RepID=A0AAV7IM11_COTGL|nr:hypothetical protein KQX54_002466 [Cotesia glomerata]